MLKPKIQEMQNARYEIKEPCLDLKDSGRMHDPEEDKHSSKGKISSICE